MSKQGPPEKGGGGILRRLSTLRRGKTSQDGPSSSSKKRDKHSDCSEHDRKPINKNWAQQYMLDPLTAPEPSQLCGPGSSFLNPSRQSGSAKDRTEDTSPPFSGSTSANSVRGSVPPEKQNRPSKLTKDERDELKLLEILGVDHRVSKPELQTSKNSMGSSSNTPDKSSTNSPRPGPAHSAPLHRKPVPGSSIRPHGSNSSPEEPKEGQLLPYGGNNVNKPVSHRLPPSTTRRLPQTTLSRSRSVDSEQVGSNRLASSNLQRNGSLSQRYPGDMSHRPLDRIKSETRTANRAPHLRKNTLPHTDVIDGLDNIGTSIYHHEGPYDPTLATRNSDKRYAPVEAVRHGNKQALKATPDEHIADSLQKHMPLQGTSTIPSGEKDMSGRRMSYEEGTDLMRDPHAPGGPYRRFEDVTYHPDDLKGKGEPSFSIERALKKKDPSRSANWVDDSDEYDMQSTLKGPKEKHVTVRQRSYSSMDQGVERCSPRVGMGESHVRRSNTEHGKKLGDGLKRRFGSLRRKQVGV